MQIVQRDAQQLVLQQEYKMLMVLGWIFAGFGVLLLVLNLPRLAAAPVVLILPAMQLLAAWACFWTGATRTITTNSTLRTLECSFKGLVRNRTNLWKFAEIKDISVASGFAYSGHAGRTRVQYSTVLLLQNGKKVTLCYHLSKDYMDSICNLIRQYAMGARAVA